MGEKEWPPFGGSERGVFIILFPSGKEHWLADRAGIHERICHLLAVIRRPAQVHFRLSERDQYRAQTLQRQEELLELSHAVAQRKLAEGKHLEALPAAQSCLCCAVDIHGPNTVQLVPAYLLLAEAHMGSGDMARAREFLSRAEWTVLNKPDCGASVQQQLHRNLGRLHTATDSLQTALFHFANDIYYANEEFGVDSPVTCGGYFLMAGVFAKQGRRLVARSLYSEVTRFWHSRLTELLKSKIQRENAPGSGVTHTSQPCIDEAQRTELHQMLRTILDFGEDGEEEEDKQGSQEALLAHCLALVWFLGGDPQKAREFGGRALQAAQSVPNLSLEQSVQELLQLTETEP